MRKRFLLLLCGMVMAYADASAQVRAEYDRGAGALSRELQRLTTIASVLHTGAHPDDEDSALIAYHARRDHARTAYLSLTRGSGGQNIIGSELGDLLGVIRTEELLQARRLDGAEQYFTRANDFGFSKNRDEGARLWDEDALLGDMVRVIRRFRPLVMVSRWDGTAADGHGHHQFAGYLSSRAFEAAADPDRFPEQIAEGLAPWPVSRLYVDARGGSAEQAPGDVVTDTGLPDPIAGRSYFQIGMRGRSQQKTQQMGSLELVGSQQSVLRLVASRADEPMDGSGIFSGIDTSLRAIAAFEETPSRALLAALDALERQVSNALSNYNALEPDRIAAALAAGLATAREARQLAVSADAQRLLDEKTDEFSRALVLAAGVTVDALADREQVVPGASLEVAVRVYGLGEQAAVESVKLAVPDDWLIADSDAAELPNEAAHRRRESPDSEAHFTLRVPRDAQPTQPYWLEHPRDGFMYDWSSAGGASGEAFSAPLVTAEVRMTLHGQPVSLAREVRHRQVDRIRGELRRRIDVVPALSIEPATDLEVIAASAAGRSQAVVLTVRNHSPRTLDASVSLEAPDGWTNRPRSHALTLLAAPASESVTFDVTVPADVTPGEYALTGLVEADGKRYRQALQAISYPHVDTHRVYRPATTTVSILDVKVAPVRIGYVMGSGDSVPEALRLLGLDVTLLDESALTRGDLSGFDSIVIGIRASQTRSDYVAANGRLLDFVRDGGTMIVQYQQPDFAEKNLAPWPVKMERNVRVVDETAPVTVLEPGHPVFRFPNPIGPSDFDGWVQERNNYNITSFDRDRYLPLTESHDPGEPDSDGAMLYARLGEGHYVYTSYSWFRQLPHGTPGGYRLFANLLSLPAAPD